MTGERHPGEGVLDVLKMYVEDYDDVIPGGSAYLDLEEVTDLLAYVESLEAQINAHPPTEIDPDVQ